MCDKGTLKTVAIKYLPAESCKLLEGQLTYPVSSEKWITNVYKHSVKQVYCHLIARIVKCETLTDSEVCVLQHGPPIDVFQLCAQELKSGVLPAKATHLVKIIYLKLVDDKALELCIKNSIDIRHTLREIVTLFVHLPTRVHNLTKEATVNNFWSASVYGKFICSCLLSGIEYAAVCIRNGDDFDITFLALLLGRFCSTGGNVALVSNFFPVIAESCRTDMITRRVVQRVICSLPPEHVESVTICILQNMQWFGHVEWFLGDSVLFNARIKFVLTDKLIRVRHFGINEFVIRNVIGYLATAPVRYPALYETLKTVVDIWGSKALIRQHTVEQQKYLSGLLLCATAYGDAFADMNENTKESFMAVLLHGVGNHLSSPNKDILTMGMLVGKKMCALLNKSVSGPEFEFDENDPLVKQLVELTVCQTEEEATTLAIPKTVEKVETVMIETSNQPSSRERLEPMKKKRPLIQIIGSDNEEDDDDDEFKPFDMFNDTTFVKDRKPISYLRDCMENLGTQADNVDVIRESLERLPQLCAENVDELQDIAVDLCKALLFIEDGILAPLKTCGMVAVLVHAPVPAATYLTQQFYEHNYTIRQRLDILNAITLACDQLSRPAPVNQTPKGALIEEVKVAPSTVEIVESRHWRQIVDERVAAKTRHFAHATPSVVTFENRFGEVAGYFFYPLLRFYDRESNNFDLLGDDAMLLCRLLNTLGVIVCCATNTPGVVKMVQHLVSFASVLRFHWSDKVRESAAFALGAAFTAVPKDMLQNEVGLAVTHDVDQWLTEANLHQIKLES